MAEMRRWWQYRTLQAFAATDDQPRKQILVNVVRYRFAELQVHQMGAMHRAGKCNDNDGRCTFGQW